jgi:hypothetical protein
MPLGRGRRGAAPADAGVLEQRSRPRNTTRPDALTRGLSAATAGRDGREGPRGRHGPAPARGFLQESEEDAEDEEDEARARSGCAPAGSCRFGRGGASGPAPALSPPVGFVLDDMRWSRFATGADRVRSGEHDGGARRAFFPESAEDAEDEDESRERSGRKCVSRTACRYPPAARLLASAAAAALGFLEPETRRRRSRQRRPAHRGARGDVGSEDAGSTARHGGGEQGADAGAGRCKGTSFPPEKSSSAAESAAAAAGTTWNSNSPTSASAGATGQWNAKGSGDVTAAAAIAGGSGAWTREARWRAATLNSREAEPIEYVREWRAVGFGSATAVPAGGVPARK